MTARTLPRRSTEAEPVVVELEDVLTIADLVRMHLAEPRERGTWVSPEGHALMGEVMRRNAAALAAAEAARPPIRTQPALSARQAALQWAREAFGES